MRFFIKTLICICSFYIVNAQVPPAFNYQAVARNNAGVALANQTIQVRLSIMQSSNTLYSETRTVTTNLLGLFNVQIGSAGASNVTGSIDNIDWLNSAPGWLALKVELDLANNNVFTDMGTQPLTSTPFSLAANTALEPVNIAGRPINQTSVPQIGSSLVWSGTQWVPKKDTVITRSGFITGILSPGLNLPPWEWVGGTTGTAQVIVTGTQTIIANYSGSFGHINTSTRVRVNVGVCYENVNNNSILPFFINDQIEADVLPAPQFTLLSATGAIKLNAGTYRIGMCIKNRSTTINLGSNSAYNGVIEVKN